MDMLNTFPIPAVPEPPKIDPILGFSPVDEALLDLKLQKLFHRFAVANLRSHIIFRPIDVQPEYRFSYENNFTLFLHRREFNAWLDFQKMGHYALKKRAVTEFPRVQQGLALKDMTASYGRRVDLLTHNNQSTPSVPSIYNKLNVGMQS